MKTIDYIRANAVVHSDFAFTGSVDIKAAAQGDGPPAFDMVAYTGGQMWLDGFSVPVVVELSGIEATDRSRPALKDHDPGRVVGHTTNIAVSDGALRAKGLVSGTGPDANEVRGSAKNGFPWQASIGAAIAERRYVAAGESVTVNNQTFKGPLLVATRTRLREISFVAMGADDNTSASIAASQRQEFQMSFEQWLKAMGFDIAKLDEKQRGSLEAKYKAEQSGNDKTDKGDTVQAAAGKDTLKGGSGNDTVQASGGKDWLTERREAEAKEVERINKIRATCAGKHAEIEAKAIREGWDLTKVELEVIRAERPQAPAAGSSRPEMNNQIIEAAVCMAGGIRDDRAVKMYGEQVVTAAAKQFNRGIGLQELLLTAAAANGYTGRMTINAGNLRDVLDHAFIRASGGFSTLSLPGILSANANKFLLESFNAVEQSWREIAYVKPANDFKTMTSYRLTGDFSFEKIAPDGEIPHGTVGEETYTNKADTYAKMFAITRQDIINDDLGALTQVPQRIGRGAGLKLNAVFWATFMDNSSFFTSGRANYISGAGTALGSAGLAAGVTAFLKLKDGDGQPLGMMPDRLLVPPDLTVTGDELYQSTNVNTGGSATTAKVPNKNVFAGRYRPITSQYLSNTNYTGYSTTAWYLFGNPAGIAPMEVAFLNGVESPTVESADADFNLLGIQMRGYFDFGVALKDYLAGIKAAGA